MRLLKRMLLVIVSVVLISGFCIMAYSEENYAALSQYYRVLALQGGNSEVSVEQANALSQYYAILAQGNGNTAGQNQAVSQPQQPVVTGSMVKVVNINASDAFFNEVLGIVNSMPEYIKQKVNSLGVVYYCYHSGSDYGADYNTGGLTSGYQTVTNGTIRSLDLCVNLSEYKNRMTTVSVIYHETGHVIDQLIWKQNGGLASNTAEFANAVNGEVSALKGIFGYNHSNYNASEWFADAFANYYLNNAILSQRCPRTYYYMSMLKY